MTPGGQTGLALVALALAGLVGLELGTGTGDEGAMDVVPPRAAAPTTTVMGLPAGSPVAAAHTRDWVQTILARPLFAPNRRPPTAAAGTVAAPTKLPRVAGIMVDGGRRSVIFAAANGGKPMVVAEGADVAGFRVQSIESGQVTVMGPDGPLVLRPSFDPSPRPAAPPGLPGLPGLTALPGLPVLGAPPAPAAR